MNLEDHAGDIVRKARLMTNSTAEAAAAAAGVTTAQLEALEQSGLPPAGLNYPALARVIGLDAAKLEAIATGWLPEPIDPAAWREFRVFTTTEEGTCVNCYLIWDEVSREAALFDTGWDAKEIFKTIGENGLQLRHIFITHSHPDHIAALAPVRKEFPKARLHTNSKSSPPEHRIRPNDFIHLGSLRVTNRDTPGHAEDGVTYIVGNWPDDAPHVAIVGDAIFCGSMGRGNQSWDVARQKVRDQILSLPDPALICAGHGPLTTVGQEKARNPFF
jgi:hydroxyacylglutathione hydrolase